MKNQIKILLLSLLLLPSIASADLVIVNGNSWDYEVSGKIRDDSAAISEVDLKTDLFLQDKKETFLLAYIEHPIPVLPNIRIGRTSISTTGSGTAVKNFTYNGQNFSASDTVTSTLTLDHTELGIYWRVLDNAVGFDLGLNVKSFDGAVKIDTTGVSVNEAFDETVPMLYAGLQIELPYGFQIAGDMSYLSFDGSSFTDTLVRLRYTSDYIIGAEIGYRSFVIDYADTDANEYVDIDFSGPYAGLHLAF